MNDEGSTVLSSFHMDAGDTLLVLVRHGQTAWNVERRFQGQLDVPLSDEGFRQAERVAGWLARLPARFAAIYSSDLRRAADTTQVIARELGIAPLYSEALRELQAGDWQGMVVADVEEKYPGQLRLWREDVLGFTIPGGEGIPALQRRVSDYVSELLRLHQGEAIVVVSHGAAISAYLAAANGWDLQETWDSRRARMSNTGVTMLAFPQNGGLLRTLLSNSIAHLDAYTDLPSVIDPVLAGETRKADSEFAV